MAVRPAPPEGAKGGTHTRASHILIALVGIRRKDDHIYIARPRGAMPRAPARLRSFRDPRTQDSQPQSTSRFLASVETEIKASAARPPLPRAPSAAQTARRQRTR